MGTELLGLNRTPNRLLELFERYIYQTCQQDMYWTYLIYFNFGNHYLRVGYTPGLSNRLHSHMSRAPEWPRGVSFCPHVDKAAAMECERYMLNCFAPYRRKPDWFLFDSPEQMNETFGVVNAGVSQMFCGGKSLSYMLKASNDRQHKNGYVICGQDGTFFLDRNGSLMLEHHSSEEEE